MRHLCWTLLAVFAIGVAGCNSGDSDESAGGDTEKGANLAAKNGSSPSTSTADSGDTADSSDTTTPMKPVVGKMAPDITGPDIDGEVFSLSDYRGKVVMLDFWGNW